MLCTALYNTFRLLFLFPQLGMRNFTSLFYRQASNVAFLVQRYRYLVANRTQAVDSMLLDLTPVQKL